jgi:hypothetical protein
MACVSLRYSKTLRCCNLGSRTPSVGQLTGDVGDKASALTTHLVGASLGPTCEP